MPSQGYAWGPVAAVGNVVGGTGQAVQGVFTGAGAIVGGVLGGVFGGVAALFGYPPSYTYGARSPRRALSRNCWHLAMRRGPHQHAGGRANNGGHAEALYSDRHAALRRHVPSGCGNV